MNNSSVQRETKTKHGCCCVSRVKPLINDLVSGAKKGGDLSQEFKVEGASCGGCVSKIEEALLAMSSVNNASMDLSTSIVTVTGTIKSHDLIQVLKKVGFVATLINTNQGSYDE